MGRTVSASTGCGGRCRRVAVRRAWWTSRPGGRHRWRLLERLHDDTVLFGFDAQRRYLVRGRLRRIDSEAQAKVLEADGHIAGDPKGATEVEVAFDFYGNAFGRDPHRGGHHLAGDLGARGQGPEQPVAGTGGAPPPPPLISLWRLWGAAPPPPTPGCASAW